MYANFEGWGRGSSCAALEIVSRVRARVRASRGAGCLVSFRRICAPPLSLFPLGPIRLFLLSAFLPFEPFPLSVWFFHLFLVELCEIGMSAN